MVRTYGMAHIALAVVDPERSFRFYERVFGMIAVYRSDDMIQAQTPGTRDVLVLERRPNIARVAGGVLHFGFRLQDPADIQLAVAAVRDAGGTIEEQGDFGTSEPFVYFRDPDGYQVEVWYELPTPVDPKN